MAVPSTTGGVTIIESCDTGGASGKTPLAPLSGSVANTPSTLANNFGTGINGTGMGRISQATGTTLLYAGVYALASTVDLTVANRFLIFHHTTDARVENISTTGGVGVILNSNSLGTEEAIYITSGKERTNPLLEGSVINASRSTNTHTYTGTFDPANVTHVGIVSVWDQGFRSTNVDSIGYFEPLIAINGTSGDKGDIVLLNSDIRAADAILNESPTNNMHHLLYPWGVGDGSTLTHFSENLKVFESVRDFDVSTTWGRAHINDNDFGYETNASSSDVIDFTLCNWISDTPFYWNSIGSTSATVIYTSCVIQNAGELTIVNGHIFDGCTFDACAEIAATAPTFTNTALNNAVGVAVSVGDNGDANMTGVLFAGNQTALKVDVAGNASLDTNEITFDASNTFFIEYTGTGTLTVTSPVAIDSGKLNESGGGTITVVAPTTTFTINSSEASSLIQIFTTATQTILASTTGTSLAHDFTGTVVVDYVIQKAGFLPQRFVAVTLTNSSVSIELMSDPIYDAAHGLTYTTDLTYNRSTSRLTLATRQEGRDFYSALIDAFIAESTLLNTEFKFQAVGPDSIFFLNDAEIIDATSEDNWKGAGIRYIDSSDVTQAEWVSVKSSGTIPAGGLAEFQQTDGSSTTDARATGFIDQIVKTFDNGVFDLRTHLVFKYQINGFREERADVLALAGISTLEPFEFTIAMQPVAINAATGDPAISITITDHGASPVTWNSLPFSITIVDNATNSGVNILREINFNLSLDATYNGKDPFNWAEMVKELGDDFDTLRGITEGGVGATLKGVRVLRGGIEHPDFTRFQSDTGVFFTPATVAAISAPNLTAGRIQIYNATGAVATAWAGTTAKSLGDYILRTTGKGTELGDGVFFVCTTAGTTGGSEPTFDVAANGNTTADGSVVWTVRPVEFDNTTTTSGYSNSWTDTEEFAAGDTIRLRWVNDDKLEILANGIATADGTTTFLNVPVNDDVQIGYGIDGSTVTDFSADYANDEIDLIVATNFTAASFYAWWKFNLTEELGIRNFFGGITAIDAANIRNNDSVVSLFWDNTTSTNVHQTDNIRIYRNDEAYPVREPTSGGGGIDIVWRDKIFLATTGSGPLTVAQDAELFKNTTILADTQTSIPNQITGLNDFDPTSEAVANVTLVATTTTNTDMRGTDSANTVAPDNASITAIKVKTDDLTFTKANELDSNIQSVNDVTVTGTGASGDEWGPA